MDAIGTFHQNKAGGMFIDSCYSHCQTLMSATWHSPTSTRIENKVKTCYSHNLLLSFFLQFNWFCSLVGTDYCRVCRWLVLQQKTGEANRLSLSVQSILLQPEFHLNVPYSWHWPPPSAFGFLLKFHHHLRGSHSRILNPVESQRLSCSWSMKLSRECHLLCILTWLIDHRGETLLQKQHNS